MLTWLAALAACAVACAPVNAANLLINSDFSDYTLNNTAALNDSTHTVYGGSFSFGYAVPVGESQNILTGWQTQGYNFIETPGHATSTGAFGPFNAMTLWGPGNGVNNGFVDAPSGSNYLAGDSAYVDPHGTLPIYQVVNNLTIGNQYKLTFDYAGAQQYGYDAAVLTEGWIVSFGTTGISGTDETYTTPILSEGNHGFTGWQSATFLFTATGTTQTLSFLATGSPSGQPPFSLLADPTLQAVPEPTTWMMMMIGFGTIGVVVRGRRDRVRKRPNVQLQAI